MALPAAGVQPGGSCRAESYRFWNFQEYVEAEDLYAVRITELILIPEPGTSLLVLAGLGSLALRHRRRG